MKALTLVWTAAATAATAALGGLATDPESRWYTTLRKPEWQPPTLAFPIVWTALYADIAVTSAVALDSGGPADAHGNEATAGAARTSGAPTAVERQKAIRAYRAALAANLALNAGWSWLFWRSRKPWLAAAEAGVLALSSADLARRTYALNRTAGVALVPYPLWCGFATVLSAAIARLNPGRH